MFIETALVSSGEQRKRIRSYKTFCEFISDFLAKISTILAAESFNNYLLHQQGALRTTPLLKRKKCENYIGEASYG